MPRIEPESGDVGHGVGGGHASRNNVPFSVGGFGGWASRAAAAFANGAAGWTVCLWDKLTGAVSQVYDPPRGANETYAGGGVVASWLGSKDETRGVYSTHPDWPRFKAGRDYQLMDAGLLGAGLDGAIAFKPSYHSGGPSRVIELDGAEWQLTPGHASALHMLGQRRAIWMEGFEVRVANLPQPQVTNEGGTWAARAAFVGGEWWLAYYSGLRGLILHPFRSNEFCYALVPTGDAWHALSAMGPDVLRVAVSRTEGEAPGDIWGYDINVRTGDAVPLPFWPQGAPRRFEFVRRDSINEAEVVIPTYSFNHDVMVAVFKDPDGMTGAHAEVLVNKNEQRAARPVFIAEDSPDGTWKGELLGVYTEKRGADLAAVVRRAAALKTRVLACHDSQDPWTLPTGLRAWDIPLVELYRYGDDGRHRPETLAQAHDRWRLDVERMLRDWPGDCGVVPMFYCMGGAADSVPPAPPELWPVEDVLDTQRYLSEMVNKSPRIKVVAPFSYLRANGIFPHVKLEQSYGNLLAAAPVPPALLPVDPPKPNPEPPKPEPPQPEPPRTRYPAAKHYEGAMSKVTFYEHVNYQGRSWTFDADTPFVGDANDNFSSAKAAPGVTVTLFEHRDYGGRSVAITGDVPDMRTLPGGWNDAVSSLKVGGAGATVRLRAASGLWIECSASGAVTRAATKGDAGKVTVTEQPDKRFAVAFTQSGRVLSVQNDGRLESRPAGTYGPFEQLSATTQPEPDTVDLLYRMRDGAPVGEVMQIVEGD